jgi:hypothetical protein
MRARRAPIVVATVAVALVATGACAGDEASIEADDGVGGFDPGGSSSEPTTTAGGGPGGAGAGGATGVGGATGAGGAGGATGAAGAGGSTGVGGSTGAAGAGGATGAAGGGSGGSPPVCAAGTADCDGQAGNGCEASTASDPAHCGGCATVCTTVHGKPSCTAGACSSACGVKAGKTVKTHARIVIFDDATEAAIDAPPGSVITGIGLRVNSDDVPTLRVRLQPVVANGSLGAAKEVRAGGDAQADLEVNVDLPPCFVLVGVGARSNSDDAKTFHVWGAPLLANGSLGAPQLFVDGSQPNEGVEVEYVAPAGRALTGVGFRVNSDDFVGMRAAIDEWQAK